MINKFDGGEGRNKIKDTRYKIQEGTEGQSDKGTRGQSGEVAKG